MIIIFFSGNNYLIAYFLSCRTIASYIYINKASMIDRMVT